MAEKVVEKYTEEFTRNGFPVVCKALVKEWHKLSTEALPHNPVAAATLNYCANKLEKILPV